MGGIAKIIHLEMRVQVKTPLQHFTGSKRERQREDLGSGVTFGVLLLIVFKS